MQIAIAAINIGTNDMPNNVYISWALKKMNGWTHFKHYRNVYKQIRKSEWKHYTKYMQQ